MSKLFKPRVSKARGGGVSTFLQQPENLQSALYGYTTQNSVCENHQPSEKSPVNPRITLVIQVLCGTQMLSPVYTSNFSYDNSYSPMQKSKICQFFRNKYIH